MLVKAQQQHQDVQTEISSCAIHPRAHSVLQAPGANCKVHTLALHVALHGSHLLPAACPSESLRSPTEHNPLWEIHLLSDSCYLSISQRQECFIIEQLTVHQKKYCLFGFYRVQAQSPNTLQLLSHDLQGYVASFLGGPWSIQLEGRNRVGWSIDWLLDWSIGSTNIAVRC